jgi:hypothetical protein
LTKNGNPTTVLPQRRFACGSLQLLPQLKLPPLLILLPPFPLLQMPLMCAVIKPMKIASAAAVLIA